MKTGGTATLRGVKVRVLGFGLFSSGVVDEVSDVTGSVHKHSC